MKSSGILTRASLQPVLFGGWTPKYLLRENFDSDEATPLATPHSCEPGPGSLLVTDTLNLASISGQALTFASGGSGSDPGLVTSQAFPQAAGRAFFARYKNNAVLARDHQVGFDGYTFNAGHNTNRGLRPRDGGYVEGIEYSPDLYQQLGIVLRTPGAYYLARIDGSPTWKLVWVTHWEYPGDLTARISQSGSGTELWADSLRVLDLPTPWNDAYGMATDRLAGLRAVGDEFTHQPDCLIEFEMTTLPADVNSVCIAFRIQDDTNYWRLDLYKNPTRMETYLREVNDGVYTTRGSCMEIPEAGDRMTVVLDGETIQVYQNYFPRISYSGASAFKTATQGKVRQLDGGGQVSDVVAWPRLISGAAVKYLKKASA